MREYGYLDVQNVTFLERWAEGRSERFPEIIEELISLKADVILAVSVSAALAAKTATTTIPIVFIASDPLGSGLILSLARPAGNLTGFSLFLGDEFSSKWLEHWHVVERSYGSFSRAIPLPFDPDPAKVEAKFDKGVLHIHLPKPAEVAKKQQKIEIKKA